MAERTDAPTKMGERELIFSRAFDAPRDAVWKALTESERLLQWWGPKGFSAKVAEVDLRPGGTFRYCLQSPEGGEVWGKWVFVGVSPPERLVTISSFTDDKGNAIRHPMEPNWPMEMLTTATLTEQDGKTTITIQAAPYNATEEESQTFFAGRDAMEEGFSGTFDKLAEYMARA